MSNLVDSLPVIKTYFSYKTNKMEEIREIGNFYVVCSIDNGKIGRRFFDE